MSFVAKQPNGLYCRFSTIVDCPTDYNLTFDDYVDVIRMRGESKESALEEANDIIKNHLRPFQDVINSFIPNNMTEEEFKEWLIEVGYEEDNI